MKNNSPIGHDGKLLMMSNLNGSSLAEAQRLASETASYVCAHEGAMPE